MHVQNARSLRNYYADIDQGRLPIERGIVMQQDDRLRAEVIMHLMCSMPVPIARLEARYGIDFASYFSSELQELHSYAQAGLLTVDSQSIQVLPKGRLFVRAYSMVFDKYLSQESGARYSRLI
jgi:oxygen-independent coproporphyrinogen-3 oxidase